jgi:predicted transcriptional regulator
MPEPIPKPTTAELAILQVLWRRGPSTVRDVHETLDTETGYTTVLKLLQIMMEKGLVTRDTSQRSHVYQAGASEEETQGQLLDDLLDRAFNGSSSRLVLRALSSRRASPDDLAEVRRLLDRMEGGSR